MTTQVEQVRDLPVPAPGRIDTVVVDYGGVLTNPLAETLVLFADRVGLDLELLAAALAGATQQYGETPMAALETGRITEAELVRRLLAHLPPWAGERLGGRPFGELWFEGRRPNEPFIELLHRLRAAGYRLALLTNNVREWEHRWRAQVPVDALFTVVVNSADEGVRKPHPQIFERLLARLGVGADRCLFVDDDELNCEVGASLGMTAVPFRDTAATAATVLDVLAAARPEGSGHARG